MDSEFYREIINSHLFPFVGKKFNYAAKLHQDNDSKHKSKICVDALKGCNINWVTQFRNLFHQKIKLNDNSR
jgi:hypothetical protein